MEHGPDQPIQRPDVPDGELAKQYTAASDYAA
jgi:hypothetical protein